MLPDNNCDENSHALHQTIVITNSAQCPHQFLSTYLVFATTWINWKWDGIEYCEGDCSGRLGCWGFWFFNLVSGKAFGHKQVVNSCDREWWWKERWCRCRMGGGSFDVAVSDFRITMGKKRMGVVIFYLIFVFFI